MSFIQKSDAVIINTKLTNAGRLLLATGGLTFKKIEFGDSEIDYEFLRNNESIIEGKDLIIMRPKDANPKIKYPIPIVDTNVESKVAITSISPLPVSITNTSAQRGFFTGSTNSGFTSFTNTTYILDKRVIASSGLTGSTILKLDSASAVTSGACLLIDIRNPKLSAFTDTAGAIQESYPRPFIWYKAISINGNNVTVDKPLPNFSGQGGSVKSVVYVYPSNNAIDNYYSTGTSVSYWNDNTLAFNSNCNIASDDVKVWNFNILYKYAPAGTPSTYVTPPYYDSAVFSGFKEYIQGYTTKSGDTMLGVIHFTNKSISNYYGEGFNGNTFKIDLPTIMYHAKTATTLGITLKSSGSTLTNAKKIQPTTLTGFTTEYYDLIETTSQNIVGKVFNDLKIAIIEDQEILNALSLKSNRSWTLPNPRFTSRNSNLSLLPVITNSNQYLAITYLLQSNNNYSATTNYGYSTGIHCGYITKLYLPSTNIPQVVDFNIPSNELQFMQSSAGLTAGTGFNANKFKIIAQKVAVGSEPDPASWIEYDYTPKLDSYSSWSATTIPVANLADRTYTFTNDQYTAGTQYYNVMNYVGTLPTTSNPSDGLAFGEESILLGNINCDIKAVVYRTKIIQKLNFNQYNTSVNPTFDDGEDEVYITEAGIYDDNNNLVAIGKLNQPIKKNGNKLFTLELDMDF